MTNLEISELLEKFILGDISPIDKEVIEKLIEEDEEVRDEFILRQKIEKAIGNKNVIDLRNQLEAITYNKRDKNIIKEPRPLYKSWYFAAALIILLCAIAFIMVQYLPASQNMDHIIAKSQKSNDLLRQTEENIALGNGEGDNESTNLNVLSIEQQSNSNNKLPNDTDKILSNNFIESPYFESFIDDFRTETIIIISPQPNESYPVGADIHFRWVQNISDSLIIRIFNNQEENIYSVNATQEFKLNMNLDHGLYYWKLETEKDLLFMNRFFVR